MIIMFPPITQKLLKVENTQSSTMLNLSNNEPYLIQATRNVNKI